MGNKTKGKQTVIAIDVEDKKKDKKKTIVPLGNKTKGKKKK